MRYVNGYKKEIRSRIKLLKAKEQSKKAFVKKSSLFCLKPILTMGDRLIKQCKALFKRFCYALLWLCIFNFEK